MIFDGTNQDDIDRFGVLLKSTSNDQVRVVLDESLAHGTFRYEDGKLSVSCDMYHVFTRHANRTGAIPPGAEANN